MLGFYYQQSRGRPPNYKAFEKALNNSDISKLPNSNEIKENVRKIIQEWNEIDTEKKNFIKTNSIDKALEASIRASLDRSTDQDLIGYKHLLPRVQELYDYKLYTNHTYEEASTKYDEIKQAYKDGTYSHQVKERCRKIGFPFAQIPQREEIQARELAPKPIANITDKQTSLHTDTSDNTAQATAKRGRLITREINLSHNRSNDNITINNLTGLAKILTEAFDKESGYTNTKREKRDAAAKYIHTLPDKKSQKIYKSFCDEVFNIIPDYKDKNIRATIQTFFKRERDL